MTKTVSITGFLNDVHCLQSSDIYQLVDANGDELGKFSLSRYDQLRSYLFATRNLGAHLTFHAIQLKDKYLIKAVDFANSTQEDKKVTKAIRYKYAVKYHWLDMSEFDQ